MSDAQDLIRDIEIECNLGVKESLVFSERFNKRLVEFFSSRIIRR